MTRRWNSFSGSFSITSSLFVALLLLLDWDQNPQLLVYGQTRNEPVNFNFIFSLPWDVANTLRAPIAGPVSLVLSVFMALMLLFGFLLAPVNYILGYPPRIYHGYRAPGILGRSLHPDAANYTNSHYYYHELANHHSESRGNNGESFDMADVLVHLFHEVSSARFVFDRDENFAFGENATGRELAVLDEQQKAPGFLESIFLLVPEEDEICRQLLVCHAHGFLPSLPSVVIKGYKLLSKHYFGIPDNYKDAIVIGLDDQSACGKIFTGCNKDLFYFARGSIGLIRRQIAKMLPSDTKDLWQKFYSKYHSKWGKEQHDRGNEL